MDPTLIMLKYISKSTETERDREEITRSEVDLSLPYKI